MNNLKRVLSLGLSGALMASLMITGASAADTKDFTDTDKIQHKTAVATMVSLGVINGKDDGSYDPEAIVTRGEMAKMICLLLNGGVEPPATTKAVPTYSDIKGHWAEKYIEYISGTEYNVISGQGDGTFNPDGPVTASAVAKMCLAANGYDPTMFNLTGVDWETNTNGLASNVNNDLYDDITGITVTAGMTRDNVAQMLYNLLDAKAVTKQYDKTVTTGDMGYTYKVEEKKTFMEVRYNAVKVEGVVVANEIASLDSNKTDKDKDTSGSVIGSAKDAGKTEVKVTNYIDQEFYKDADYTFNLSTGADVLGQKVSFYASKENNVGNAKIFGAAVASEDNKVVTDASSDSIKDVADDNDLDFDGSAVLVTNYAQSTKLTSAKIAADATAGVAKTLIDVDGDGDVDYVLENYAQFGKVTRYNTADKGAITVSLASGSYIIDNSANVVGFEDVALNDYVLASFIGGKLNVKKAEAVTGTLAGYKNNSADTLTTKLTVDETDYNVSAVAAVTVAGDEVYPAKTLFTGGNKAALDTEATFYLDGNGYIIARGQVTDAVYNYAYVIAADSAASSIDSRVKVALPDGKTGTYNLSDKSSVKQAEAKTGEKTVFAYSLANDGKDIKLTVPGGVTVKGGSAVFDKGKSTITIKGATTQYANKSTVFYYVDTDDTVTAYKGRDNAPSITASTSTAVYKNASGIVTAVVFSGVTSKTSVGDHMFVYSTGNIGTDYTRANVVLNGASSVEKDVKIDAGSSVSADTLYTYELNSDKFYELTSVASEKFYTDGTVAQAYGDTIVVSGGKNPKEVVIDSNTVVIDNHDTSATPSITLGGNINVGDKVQVLVDDDHAKMVVITKLADSTTTNNGGTTVLDPTGVTGTAMTAYDTAADINAELKNNNVILSGNWTNDSAATPSTGISIPAGKTLVINGNLAATTGISNSGTVIVTGAYTPVASQDTLGTMQVGSMVVPGTASTVKGNLTVTGNVTGAQALTVASGATLAVKGTTTANIVASGATTLEGNVTGNITVLNSVAVSAEKDVTGNVILTKGSATIGGKLTGDATLSDGNLTVTGDLTGDVTQVKGKLTVVDGSLTDDTFAVIVDANRSLSVGKDLTCHTVTLTAGKALAVGGKLTVATGDVDLLAKGASLTVGGDTTVTTADVNVGDSSRMTVDGKLTVTAGSVAVDNGGSLTVDGDLALSATNSEAITVGATAVSTLNVTGNVTVGNNAFTITNGNVNVDGIVDKITTLTKGNVTVGKDLTAITTITDGSLTVGGNMGTPTTFTAGSLTLGGTATMPAIVTLSDVTFTLGEAAVLTLSDSQAASSTLNITGVDGAKLVSGSNGTNVTVSGSSTPFYTTGGATAVAGALVASKTYLYSTDNGNTGFIQQP